jgi:hypothetical protein
MNIGVTFPQFIFIVTLFVIVIPLAYFSLRLLYRRFQRPDLFGFSREQIRIRWQEIEKVMEQKNEMNYKLALIEADKLLDHVLKAVGFPGGDMGQRLKAACYKHESLRKVWFAHKMRNQLVHESSFYLTYWQAKDAIKAYKRSLNDLHVL